MDKTYCIVVIIYMPSDDVKERLFVDNCHNMIVVDNTPHSQMSNIVFKENIDYISLGENKGIATAQNIAIKRAKELGYKYVIFFDQDSEYDSSYVSSIIGEYEKIQKHDCKIATLGPLVVNKTTNKAYKNEITSKSSFNTVDTIISSGSIVEIAKIDIIGGLEDRLFIDLVDHEWCWRAKSYGYNCYQTSSIILNHKVGNESLSIFGFPIIISSPFRYYYKYRNFLWMLERPYVPIKWKIKEAIRKIIEIIIVPLSTRNLSIYRFMFKGIKDGI